MRLVTTLWALLLAAPAAGGIAGAEFSGELGTLHNSDPTFDLFSSTDAMPSRGLRLGIAPVDRITVLAGWHHVGRGSVVEFEESDERFYSAFLADEFTLGAKLDAELGEWFYPYVSGNLMLIRGQMRFDDNDQIDFNANQLKASSLAPGLLGMAGTEFRVPQKDGPVTIAWHLEMGYGWVGRTTFEDFGDMKPGGFALRSGLGLRF